MTQWGFGESRRVPPSEEQIAEFRERAMRGEISPADLVAMMGQRGHGGLLGLRYEGHGDNWIELAFDYDESLVGDRDTGILASGPVVSLCDSASGMAIMLTTKRFFQTVTIDLRVDYLRPARVGNRVYGHIECYRHTKNMAFVRGHAHDGDPDRQIANVTGTFMMLPMTF